MTTKIITPQEVTPEMLVAGVESNETIYHWPVRYKLAADGSATCHISFSGKWTQVAKLEPKEVRRWMNADSNEGTIWTTPIQETAQ